MLDWNLELKFWLTRRHQRAKSKDQIWRVNRRRSRISELASTCWTESFISSSPWIKYLTYINRQLERKVSVSTNRCRQYFIISLQWTELKKIWSTPLLKHPRSWWTDFKLRLFYSLVKKMQELLKSVEHQLQLSNLYWKRAWKKIKKLVWGDKEEKRKKWVWIFIFYIDKHIQRI